MTNATYSESIIMDDESETFITGIVNDIKDAMKVTKRIDIYISDSHIVNASATINGNIIINVGLIMKCSNVKELIAVLSHEIGHISGSHIIKFLSESGNFQRSGLIPILVGTITSIISMNPSPFIFGIAGGGHVSQRLALAKLRNIENMADTSSIEAIKKLGWPVIDGFVSIHEKLAESPEINNNYMSTHPSSEDRISKFKDYQNSMKNVKYSPEKVAFIEKLEKNFQKIKNKIRALAYPPENTISLLKNDDYARSIAYYRNHEYGKSLELIDRLLSKSPHNPYYTEIKSMILTNQKKLEEAVRISLEALENNRKLICRDLSIICAHSASELNQNNNNIEKIIQFLKKLLLRYKDDATIYDMLGKMYTIQGKNENASLCSANISFIMGDLKSAKIHAERALKSKDKAIKNQALDILNAIKN